MSSVVQFVALCTVFVCVLCNYLLYILARSPWTMGPLLLVKQCVRNRLFNPESCESNVTQSYIRGQ